MQTRTTSLCPAARIISVACITARKDTFALPNAYTYIPMLLRCCTSLNLLPPCVHQVQFAGHVLSALTPWSLSTFRLRLDCLLRRLVRRDSHLQSWWQSGVRHLKDMMAHVPQPPGSALPEAQKLTCLQSYTPDLRAIYQATTR